MSLAPIWSSNKDDWETPHELFARWNNVYHFTLDAAASATNTKCAEFYGEEKSGLLHPWKSWTWCNPPYSLNKEFVAKAAAEQALGNYSVLLLPARTDTRWFHQFIYRREGVGVEFLKGRLKFSGSKNSAPFPSMIVIFGGRA